MKLYILVLTLFGAFVLNAQSQEEGIKGFFSQLKNDALILSDNGLIQGRSEIKKFVANFVASNGIKDSYEKYFSIEVSSILDYEAGEVSVDSKLFSVMFLKRKGDESGPWIEFLIIYEKEHDAKDQLSDVDRARKEWMRLCNAHRADELVKRLYASNAYYFNRGRLLQGTKSLTAEYSYMNSPDYSLKLTPKHIAFVTSDKAFEIGQCSGSYPNPYMIVWEKQADGRWVVLMDSND